MRRLRSQVLLAGLCAALSFGTAESVLADARDLFKEALEASERGDWATVESKARAAIALDPQEDKKTFGKDYLPHYLLGVALQEQGNCRGAGASWRTAESQGVAKASKDAADLPRRRQTCADLLETLAASVSEAESAVAKARAADGELGEMSGSQALRAYWAPFETRRQSALQRLVEAERLLERGNAAENPEQVREAADTASQITSQLHTIAADARAKAGQVGAASARAQGDLDEAESSASSALRAVRNLEPLPPELAAQAEELRALLAEVSELRRSGGGSTIRDHSRKLAEGTRLLKNMASPPPTWLAEAAQSLLAQDFLDCIERLQTAEPNSERERFHVAMLRAACRFEVWVEGAERDDSLYEQVQGDLGEAVDVVRAAQGDEGAPGYASPRFLSPRLRALWNEQRVAAGLAEESEENVRRATSSHSAGGAAAPTAAGDSGGTPR